MLLLLSTAACGNEQSSENTASPAAESQRDADVSAPAAESSAEAEQSAVSDGNILIAYFSVPETDGVDTVAGASRVVVDGEVLGNNQYIAQLIQQETGGELFRIETVQEYPGSHDPLLEFGYNEKADDARPELEESVENLSDYDTVFLGYPIWWGIAAWPVDSFVEANDFTWKTVIPFCTSASSGLGDSGALLAEMAGTGDWQEGMRFRSGADEADVQEWVSGLGL